MNIQLCKAFPALTPFAVRRERAVEVFALVRRINERPQDGGSTSRLEGVDCIRRPAGDNWF